MANSTVKKGASLAKQIKAQLVGDDKGKQAEQIARKAMSAVDGQIATQKARQVDLEANLEDAKDDLAKAIAPTERFRDNQAYCANILNAQEAVDAAQDELDDCVATIEYFEGLASNF